MKHENLGKFLELKRKYTGKCLIEIAQKGNQDSLSYLIAESPKYEKLLWQRDNQLNPEDNEFIGMTSTIQL